MIDANLVFLYSGAENCLNTMDGLLTVAVQDADEGEQKQHLINILEAVGKSRAYLHSQRASWQKLLGGGATAFIAEH